MGVCVCFVFFFTRTSVTTNTECCNATHVHACTCMSSVYDRLNSVPGSEVDQFEGAKAVVGFNMARDDVDGRLSPSPAERPGDARPFRRGIFCGKRERLRDQTHTFSNRSALDAHIIQSKHLETSLYLPQPL